MARDEDDTDVETIDGDQVVEVDPAEVVEEMATDPVTKPHDGGEWLQGFNKGVSAGRNDYENALRRVMGDGPLFNDIAQKVRLLLGSGT